MQLWFYFNDAPRGVESLHSYSNVIDQFKNCLQSEIILTLI